MRKYVVGFLAGILLTFAVSVSAEEVKTAMANLIGQTVQGQLPVTVNGVKLDEPAAVIDNNGEPKGYLPIRAMGEALGVQISFDSDGGIFVNGTPESVTDATYADQLKLLQKQSGDLLITLNQVQQDKLAQSAIYRMYENSIYLAENNGKIKDNDLPIYQAAKKKWEELNAESENINQQLKTVGAEITELQDKLNK